MEILELENRCTGNRTVGSNSTLSAIVPWKAKVFVVSTDSLYRQPRVTSSA